MRQILIACTQLRFAVDHVDMDRSSLVAETPEAAQDLADFEGTEADAPRTGVVSLSMQVKGKRPVSHLIARLSDLDGVVHVGSLADEAELE